MLHLILSSRKRSNALLSVHAQIYAVTAFRKAKRISRTHVSTGEAYTLAEEEVPGSSGPNVFQASGFALDKYPGKVFTVGHALANVEATAAHSQVIASKAMQVYVTPLRAYAGIPRGEQDEPAALLRAGARPRATIDCLLGLSVQGRSQMNPVLQVIACISTSATDIHL